MANELNRLSETPGFGAVTDPVIAWQSRADGTKFGNATPAQIFENGTAGLDEKAVPTGADRVVLIDSETDPEGVKSARIDNFPIRRPSVRSALTIDETAVDDDEGGTVLLGGSVSSFELRSDLPVGWRCKFVSQRATPLSLTLGGGSAVGMTFPGVSAMGQVVYAEVISNAGDAAVWVLDGASEEP